MLIRKVGTGTRFKNAGVGVTKSSTSKGATVKDVAKKAGVSIASVSRVVNNLGTVATPTRDAILSAIETLNYTPHSAGRALVTRRNNLIGVILPDIYGEYFSELVRGIDIAARAHKQHILVASSHGDGAEARQLIKQMYGRIDGLILMSPYLGSSELESAIPAELPTILLNGALSHGRSSITIDNFNGAKAAVEHLIKGNKRNIAFIGGPDGNIEAEQRLAGYQEAISNAKGAVKAVIMPGDFTEMAGARAGEDIAACSHEIDAVFAANDMMALGCLSVLARKGINVPKDIAVVGFDDVPLARFVQPALTTIGVNITDMGRNALDQVFAQINGENRHVEDIIIQPSLIVRGSCGIQE